MYTELYAAVHAMRELARRLMQQANDLNEWIARRESDEAQEASDDERD